MVNDIYFVDNDGKLVSNHDIAKIAFIINNKHINSDDLDTIRTYAATCKGIQKEIDPSIKNYPKNAKDIKVQKLNHFFSLTMKWICEKKNLTEGMIGDFVSKIIEILEANEYENLKDGYFFLRESVELYKQLDLPHEENAQQAFLMGELYGIVMLMKKMEKRKYHQFQEKEE